jgi:hypothetical protein
MGTEGPSPGGKAQPGRDADHSPPSRVDIVNEYELYLLSSPAPPYVYCGTSLRLPLVSATVYGVVSQGASYDAIITDLLCFPI